MKRITIKFDDKTLRRADRAARFEQISRNEFFRRAVKDALSGLNHRSRMIAGKETRTSELGRRERASEDVRDWPMEKIVHAFRYPWEGKSQRLWALLRRGKRATQPHQTI